MTGEGFCHTCSHGKQTCNRELSRRTISIAKGAGLGGDTRKTVGGGGVGGGEGEEGGGGGGGGGGGVTER